MDYPNVNTKCGMGRLFKIEGNKAYVEFDFLYLVELLITEVELSGVDMEKMETKEDDCDER